MYYEIERSSFHDIHGVKFLESNKNFTSTEPCAKIHNNGKKVYSMHLFNFALDSHFCLQRNLNKDGISSKGVFLLCVQYDENRLWNFLFRCP